MARRIEVETARTSQAGSSVGMRLSAKAGSLSGNGRRYVGPDHFLRIHYAIEFSFGHEAELQCSGLEREVVVIRIMSNLRSLVIADNRRKGRDQHERLFDVLSDLLQIGLGSFHQEF